MMQLKNKNGDVGHRNNQNNNNGNLIMNGNNNNRNGHDSNDGHSSIYNNNNNINNFMQSLEIEMGDNDNHNNNNKNNSHEEEEIDSLIYETAGGNYRTREQEVLHKRIPNFLFNRLNSSNTNNNNTNTIINVTNNIRGLVRSSIGFASSYRSFCTLTMLGFLSLIIINILNYDVHHLPKETGLIQKQQKPIYNIHSGSLGGHRNPGHYNQEMFVTDDVDLYAYKQWLAECDKNSPNDNDDDGLQYDACNNNDKKYKKSSDTNKNNYNIPLTGFIGTPIISFTNINNENANGHYWHDPIKSPYSSPLYKNNSVNNISTTELINQNENIVLENNEFLDRLKRTIELFGQWEEPSVLQVKSNNTTPTTDNGNDNSDTYIPISPNFTEYNKINRDIPASKFPYNSWHLQKDYVIEFLNQAKKLVDRVKEGIYIEYGMGMDNNSDKSDNVDPILQKQRDGSFGIQILEYDDNNNNNMIIDTYYGPGKGSGSVIDNKTNKKIPCGTYINKVGYDGLVRKLLHSIITQDKFYTVSISAGSHTYNNNNFFQSTIMQFQYIMEPIFDKLGIKLISRNMGMNTSTTIINSLGGNDIYGEADIVWYIPDDRKPSSSSSDISSSDKWEIDGHFDLSHIQSILSGRRMPLLLTPNPGSIIKNSNLTNSIWMGNIQPGYEHICYDENNKFKNNLYSCQYVDCNNDDDVDKSHCDKQYNSVCWIERSDWNPVATKQDKSIGSNNELLKSQNPNQHKLYSRKFAMLILHALDDAINQWYNHINNNKNYNPIINGFLPDDVWHVSNVYNTTRGNVRTNIQQQSSTTTTSSSHACDDLLKPISSEICHLEMHAYTEWTPRVTQRLKDIVIGQITDVNNNLHELYTSIDLLPNEWKVPMKEIDVHMISIAANTSSMISNMLQHPNPVPALPLPSSSGGGISTGEHEYHDDITWANETDDDILLDFSKKFNNNDGFNRQRQERRHLLQINNTINEKNYNEFYDNFDSNVDDDTIIGLSHREGIQNQNISNDDAIVDIEQQQLQILLENQRRLQLAAVSKKSWSVYKAPIGYCDGSSQSRCNRIVGNSCLLSNFNHYQAGLIGHGDSGPLVLKIRNIKEGIILLRFDWNNVFTPDGTTKDMSFLPDDFQFTYIIKRKSDKMNETKKVLSKNDFQQVGVRLADDVIIHPLLNEVAKMGKEEKITDTIELTIQIASVSAPTTTTLLLTHLYYA